MSIERKRGREGKKGRKTHTHMRYDTNGNRFRTALAMHKVNERNGKKAKSKNRRSNHLDGLSARRKRIAIVASPHNFNSL